MGSPQMDGAVRVCHGSLGGRLFRRSLITEVFHQGVKPEESQRAGVSPWGGGFETCVCLAGRGGEQDLCRPWGGVSRAEWKCPSSSLHSHLLQRRLIPVQLRGSGPLRLFLCHPACGRAIILVHVYRSHRFSGVHTAWVCVPIPVPGAQ